MLRYEDGELVQFAINNQYHLVHGANCQNVMGSGVAVAIKRKLPPLYKADTEFNQEHRNTDYTGKFSYAAFEWGYGFNLYTQQYYSWYTNFFKPDAFKSALIGVIEFLKNKKLPLRIAMPKIGSMRGGDDWINVLGVLKDIDELYPEAEIVIINYTK